MTTYLKTRFRKIKSILNNQKGFSALELTIGTLIIIMIICGAVDLSKTASSHNAVSSLTNFAARTLAEQGSLAQKKPTHYQGDYVTTAQLLDAIEEGMSSVGVPSEKWQLLVNGTTITSKSKPIEFDFKTFVNVEIQYSQGFTLLNQSLPLPIPEFTKKTHRRVLTTYFYRTDTGGVIH